MQKNGWSCSPNAVRTLCLMTALALLNFGKVGRPQAVIAKNPYFSRANSFGVFGAYSNDSSHILLGDAENRRLLSFGVSYSRRLFINHVVNWQYDGELLPVALESDPLSRYVNNQTLPTVTTTTVTSGPIISCAAVMTPYTYELNGITYSGTEDISCHGREWRIGEAMSPVGLQWNFLPRRRLQPLVVGHGGYMYSTQATRCITQAPSTSHLTWAQDLSGIDPETNQCACNIATTTFQITKRRCITRALITASCRSRMYLAVSSGRRWDRSLHSTHR